MQDMRRKEDLYLPPSEKHISTLKSNSPHRLKKKRETSGRSAGLIKLILGRLYVREISEKKKNIIIFKIYKGLL